MSAQELLLTTLNQRYEKYRPERKRCKDEFSEEAVHDLRIATRRLLALIELLRVITLAKHPVGAKPRLQKLRRVFKDQLNSLNDLRDTQVMSAEISEMLESLPELIPLQKFLQKREKRLLKTAEREVGAIKISGISHQVEKLRASLAEPAVNQDLTARLFLAVDDAYLKVTLRMRRVDPAQPASIHRVRIAFKEFRYMLEIIHSFLPGFSEVLLKNLNNYQTAMGEIQDVEVMLHTLEDFAAKHKAYDPQPVQHFYEQHHAELINAYIENMNEFANFWRESPDKPFPWESYEKDQP